MNEMVVNVYVPVICPLSIGTICPPFVNQCHTPHLNKTKYTLNIELCFSG